jgi:hypothetical protein
MLQSVDSSARSHRIYFRFPGIADMAGLAAGPTRSRMTHSGRWMFGRIFRFGRHESYRGLRLELLFSLTV